MTTYPTQTSNPDALQEGNAAPHARPVTLAGELWKYAVGLLMVIVIYSAFYVVKGAQGFNGLGNTSRIVFFHVPVAILCYLVDAVATVYAVYVLRKGSLDADGRSAAAMEIGFLYCVLTTITGSIFSRAQWGAYWNWAPRQTSIIMLLLLFASYLMLRAANRENLKRRARFCAVFTILTQVPAFFLIWIVPRVLSSFHPTHVISQPSNNSTDYNITGLVSFAAFSMLTVWIFQLRYRMNNLMLQRQLARMPRI